MGFFVMYLSEASSFVDVKSYVGMAVSAIDTHATVGISTLTRAFYASHFLCYLILYFLLFRLDALSQS